MTMTMPLPLSGLSARLIALTVAFVMLGEILIFAPSVARFRESYLEMKLASAHLAALAVEAAPGEAVDKYMAEELLRHVGARGVTLYRTSRPQVMIDGVHPPAVAAMIDLREAGFFSLIGDAFATLVRDDNRILQVIGVSPQDTSLLVEILLEEEPMRHEMMAFAMRILTLSIVLSAIAAVLMVLSLRWLFVRPMRRFMAAMMAFREDPESAANVIAPSGRNDEIGRAERELAVLQETVRQALRQQARLAALGTAVAKVNHDLRGMLATAQLVSDGLAESPQPEVRHVAARLMTALDRAVELCTRTLDFTREGAPPLNLSRFDLATLVREVIEDLPRAGRAPPTVETRIPSGFRVDADRAQFHRVLQNLFANAAEAGATRLVLTALEDDSVVLDISDDGPGLPPKAKTNLFRPFAGSARPGGTGLGLAIVREVLRAHGGDIGLVESAARGTTFRLTLPRRHIRPLQAEAA